MKLRFLGYLISILMVMGIFTFNFPQAAAVDACITPPADMISWWPGDGTANDIMDANNGTLEGGATFAAGKVDQAFSFDGVDDYVNSGSGDNLNISEQITMDAWIKFSQKPTEDDWYNIVSKGKYEMYVYTNNSNVTILGAYFWINENEVDLYDQSTIEINPNEWTHVAVTYDGTNINAYVNGQLDFTYNAPGAIDRSQLDDFQIAREVNSDHYFNGLIDEVEVFNRALSQPEIQSIYDAGSAGKCKQIQPNAPTTPSVTEPAENSTYSTGTPTFKGTGDANNTILLTVNSTTHNYTATIDQNGNWQFTIPQSDLLENGDHTLIVQARDGDGNLSGTRTVHFKVVVAAATMPVTGGNSWMLGYIFGLLFLTYVILSSYKLLRKN